MANDCLQTKLKTVVDNDNLPFIDSLIIKSKTNSDGFVDLRTPGTDVDVRVECLTPNLKLALNYGDGTVISDTVIKIHGNTGAYGFLVKNSDDSAHANSIIEYKVTSKYNINALFGAIKNIEHLGKNTNLNVLNCFNNNSTLAADVTGDIKVFSGISNLKTIILADTKVYGDISSIANLEDIGNIALNTAGEKLTGRTVDLPYIKNGQMNLGNNLISGSIEDFVAKMRAKSGYESGVFTMYNFGNPITYEGNVIGSKRKRITWTADSITVENV